MNEYNFSQDAHIHQGFMLCVLFYLHLAVITAKEMAAAEMDVRNWRCVIHLNTVHHRL